MSLEKTMRLKIIYKQLVVRTIYIIKMICFKIFIDFLYFIINITIYCLDPSIYVLYRNDIYRCIYSKGILE